MLTVIGKTIWRCIGEREKK